jgi:acyl-CoA synthetase (AMP-forming)/AMP-acid ligase II
MADEATMGRLLSASIRRHARLPAVRDGRRSMTYAEMADWSGRLANLLRARGLVQGDRVAVLAEDTVEGIAAYLGVWLAGCSVVHVNARLAAPEVQYIVEDAEVRALLHTPGLADLVADLDRLEDLAFVSDLDDAEGARFGIALGSASTVPPPVTTKPEDCAIVGYTSGTSGRPKGAIASHRAVVLISRLAPYMYRIPPRSTTAYSGSLSFIGSVWGQAFPHLYVGGTVRLLGHYQVDSWFAAIREERANFTYVPTPLVPDFTAGIEAEPKLLEHLTTVFHAGSLTPRPQVEALIDVIGERYVETYGSTEMIGSATATTPEMFTRSCEAADIYSSGGRPVACAEVWIEAEDGSRVDPGVEGEIVAKVDTGFDGYWNAEEKTAEAMRGGGFHSGDVGYFDDAGFLYVSGRRSEMIVSGGMNVYPAEVERVILSDPGVREVAVFGVPHPRWGEGVVAAVVADPGAAIDEDGIVELCRGQLASYKKPTRVALVGRLPLNAARKVDKRALTQLFEDDLDFGGR